MHKEKLLKLAALLETVPRDKFDMSHFKRGENGVGECGTVACAAGWATTIPEFNKEGFKLSDLIVCYGIKYKEETGFNAISKFFDISLTEAFKLFNTHKDYRTPKQVAKRLRKFVKTEEVPK